jgi:hypothetical protein
VVKSQVRQSGRDYMVCCDSPTGFCGLTNRNRTDRFNGAMGQWGRSPELYYPFRGLHPAPPHNSAKNSTHILHSVTLMMATLVLQFMY